MDSITHLVLGGCIAAAIAPPGRRRAAMLIGAALGTLPDLDVLPLAFTDPVTRFTAHRSFTHSVFVLPFVAVLAWWALRRIHKPTRDAPLRWLAVCAAALISHPLLDAFTVYGTHLWWPLDVPPAMISSLFIIDPLFTLPLIGAAIAAWRLRERPRATAWLIMGLALSGAYLGWTLVAKHHLEGVVRARLASHGIPDPKLLTVPTPFNSLLWRVLVIGADGYAEGFYSFAADGDRLRFTTHAASREVLLPLRDAKAVQQLQRFTRGFYAVEEHDGKVVFTDLRMGLEPDYVFRFIVGERREGIVLAVEPPRQLPWPRWSRAQLARVWRRIFMPEDPAPAAPLS